MAEKITYLITRADVQRVLSMADAVEAVEAAFRAYGEGKAQMPAKMYLDFEKGDLRCMPAYIPEIGFASVKNVNVHPGNDDLPTVMATVTLLDPETGFPVAIMDGTYLTAMRTGAAGGIAARHLARKDSTVAGFIGAGRQAGAQLAALMVTMPAIEKVLVCDLNEGRARAFAKECAEQRGMQAFVRPLPEVVGNADVLTTVTPAPRPVVSREHLRPGTHINAIGADAAGKQELEASVLQEALIVIDNWEQARHSGEINVPLARGLISRGDIHADIGELVTGRKPGRRDAEQITVFDSTGLAIQDLACAAHVFRRLTAAGEGHRSLQSIDFLGTRE